MKGVSQTPKRRGKKLSFFVPDFKEKPPEIREDDPNVLTDKRGERSVCTCVSEFALPPTSSKIIDLFNLTALGYILSPSRAFILLVFCRAVCNIKWAPCSAWRYVAFASAFLTFRAYLQKGLSPLTFVFVLFRGRVFPD